MSLSEMAHHGNEAPNGSFLASIEPQAARTFPLLNAVEVVTRHYIREGELSFALRLIKDQHITNLSDYRDNSALAAFAGGAVTISGFNDARSSGAPTSRDDYFEPAWDYTTSPELIGNTDPVKRPHMSFQPAGFEIGQNQQPVMVIVALDPTALDPAMADVHKTALKDEVMDLFKSAAGDDEVERDAASSRMSDDLRQILRNSLINNQGFDTHNPDGTVMDKWLKPFDLVASLKALYLLLSENEDTSAIMRQGAVRVTKLGGRQIIVGCSGLNSAIDEMVARNFAEDVLAVNL